MNRAEKLRLSGISKFGTEKAWREHMAESGRKGGMQRTELTKLRGYGSHPDLAKQHADKRWSNKSS